MISIHLFQASTKKPLRLGSQPNPKFPTNSYPIRNIPNSKKRAFFEICPRKNPPTAPLFLTSHRPLATNHCSPHPPSSKTPTSGNIPPHKNPVTLEKTCHRHTLSQEMPT
jgi:hypothetical protein